MNDRFADRVKGKLDWFRKAPNDSSLAVTQQVFSLDESSFDRPAVLFVGDTSFACERLIEKVSAVAPKIECMDLRSNDQTLWESAAILDRSSDRPGLVVIDVSSSRFIVPWARLKVLLVHPTLGFRSRAFDQELERADFTARSYYDNYVLDNSPFLVDRIPYLFLNLLGWESQERVTAPRVMGESELSGDSAVQLHQEVLQRLMERVLRLTRYEVALVAFDAQEPKSGPIDRQTMLTTTWSKSTRVHVLLPETSSESSVEDRVLAQILKSSGSHDE